MLGFGVQGMCPSTPFSSAACEPSCTYAAGRDDSWEGGEGTSRQVRTEVRRGGAGEERREETEQARGRDDASAVARARVPPTVMVSREWCWCASRMYRLGT